MNILTKIIGDIPMNPTVHGAFISMGNRIRYIPETDISTIIATYIPKLDVQEMVDSNYTMESYAVEDRETKRQFQLHKYTEAGIEGLTHLLSIKAPTLYAHVIIVTSLGDYCTITDVPRPIEADDIDNRLYHLFQYTDNLSYTLACDRRTGDICFHEAVIGATSEYTYEYLGSLIPRPPPAFLG